MDGKGDTAESRGDIEEDGAIKRGGGAMTDRDDNKADEHLRAKSNLLHLEPLRFSRILSLCYHHGRPGSAARQRPSIAPPQLPPAINLTPYASPALQPAISLCTYTPARHMTAPASSTAHGGPRSEWKNVDRPRSPPRSE